MSEDGDQGSVAQKYLQLVSRYGKLESNHSPKNSKEYQGEIWELIKNFRLLERIVSDLDLFSDNEFIEEINVNYLPFFNIPYYLGQLYMEFMADENLNISLDFKPDNLNQSKLYFNAFLDRLKELEVLNPLQLKQLEGTTLSREDKILQYRYEKQLSAKIASAEKVEDEDIKREIYLDEINLYIIKALNQLQMLDMEIKVLLNRPKEPQQTSTIDSRENQKKSASDDGYTTKLETLPQNQPINKLINKGRVLQPFTLTREDLKKKVFGTGQVLPSMTVEEYLDYELANGKMMKPEEPAPGSDESDDEQEEYRKRDWDDWKDDNPKGIGNTMNLG